MFTIDNGCIVGGSMVLLGLAGGIVALASWANSNFSDMDPQELMRISIPSVLSMGIGLQVMLTSFLIELLSQPARSQEG